MAAPESLEVFYADTNREAFERSPYPGMLTVKPRELAQLIIRDGDMVETIYRPLEADLVRIFSHYRLSLVRFYEIVRGLEPTVHTILIDAEIYRKADQK